MCYLVINENIAVPRIPATRVKGGSRRDSWGIEGHSENPVITRTKRYYLVERDLLKKDSLIFHGGFVLY